MKLEQIAVNSVSNLPHPLEAVLDAYANAGFRNVEFCLQHVWDYLAKDASPRDVRRLLDERGLTSIGGFETVIECFSDKSARTKNHERVRQNAKLLATLGGGALVVGTDAPDRTHYTQEALMATVAGVVGDVADSIVKTGVTICIEFNWSPVIRSVRSAAEVVRQAKRRNVGMLFDPAHFHCTPSKFDDLDTRTAKTIRHVHVNNMRDVPGEFADCNADRVLPGKGCLNLKAIFGAIERHGYSGYFSLEMFDEALWAMPPRTAAKRMYASMAKLVKTCR